jgi:hypothetical protein
VLCWPLVLQADELERQGLFRIERNKNANIIQYDAQVTPDGKLDNKNPVVGYWIRLAEHGQVQKLSWIQKKFAFGFKADLDVDSEAVSLDMVIDPGQLISVRRYGQDYKAIMDIGGKLSQLEKIYIHATGKGLSTRIIYLELYGMELDGGEETYQRFVP